MKALFYILVLITAILSSCASSLYVGGEFDDLYYSPSDKPVVAVQKSVPEQIAQENIKPDQYYDNAYANDTLVADGYNNAVDFDNSMFYNNNNSAFEYMDDYSYSNRLRRFYGNYFDPYLGSSLSFGFGYPSFGFGYGYGYPYYGGGYGMYDPYYGYGYGGMYGGMYGGYYGFYTGYGYYPGYYSGYNTGESRPPVAIGRRSTYSTLSNNYVPVSPSRKSNNQSTTEIAGQSRRANTSTQNLGTESRRANSVGNNNSRQSVSSLPENRYSQSGTMQRRDNTNSSNQTNRPEYKSVNRTYTPSYNNPRMSTRPSYNNSRIQSGTNSNVTPNISAPANQKSIENRRAASFYNRETNNSSIFNGQNRSVSSNPGRSESYSVPSRNNMESGSGFSNTRSSSYSGTTTSSPARISSGSSSYSGGGGSSVSSGSSGGSSHSSSGSSGSSTTRR